MPQYLYRCPNNHVINVTHGMMETVQPFCPSCGEAMTKKPQVPTVLWSRFIEPSPAVKHHLDNLEAYKERNAQKYGS